MSLAATAAVAQSPPLRIGNVLAQLDSRAPESFLPFSDYLSARIPGRSFEIVPLESLDAMVQAADAGQLDFIIGSPVTLVTLNSRHRVRPIATVTQSLGGHVYPWLAAAVFVADDRHDLRRLEDVKGKRVLGLAPTALGGWLAAVREWRHLGIDEQTDFASVRFQFSYQDVAAEVCVGTADAGVLPAGTLSTLATPCARRLRVLPAPDGNDVRYPVNVSSSLYPEAAFAAVGDLDETLVTQVAVALLSIEDDGPVARAAAVSGFTAPLSYTPVQQLMEELHVGPYESYGRLTFRQAIEQHAGKVIAGMLAFLSVLLFAFIRTRRLNIRLRASMTQQERAEQERTQLESQLQQAQRLESVGRLAGAIAHDFNNLLTVINGYSEILLLGRHDADPTKEDLTQIHRAGVRAAELTSQLLTFSKRQVAELVPLDLNAIVRDAEPLLRRLIGPDIELAVRLNSALHTTLADTGQMHQVLMNLVVNARDAMPSGGTIRISTDNVTIIGPGGHPVDIPLGDYAMLTVADTGTGMDAATQQQIFEPFFSTKGELGTGLGLSTVYGIVRQRQGGIGVLSSPGLGTTFHIYLPRTDQRPEPATVVPRTVATAPAWTQRILVVEDQDEVRGFALDVLRASGYQVLEASSGDDAFALFHPPSEPIHLLLTDVVMRGMNGRELSDHFRRAHPEAGVLFTSGYPDDDTARRGVPHGTLAFLPKPYSREALLARVTELLSTAS